jgi:serine/threonine-protein kinase HipA
MTNPATVHPEAEAIHPALFTFFEAMPRQGPGSAETTRALYQRVRPHLADSPRVADMGCGSGAAGLVLAEAGARVTGVDIHQPFLDRFKAEAEHRGFGERVTVRRASMTDSGLPLESLDLVWSEGAAFAVGYANALAAFHALLAPGGFTVVSDCAWLQRDIPAEASDFWDANYPAMGDVAEQLRIAVDVGFRFVHAEVLPRELWETEFYAPMERLIADLDPDDDPDLWAVAVEERAEIEMFRQHGDAYGYVFVVLEKP